MQGNNGKKKMQNLAMTRMEQHMTKRSDRKNGWVSRLADPMVPKQAYERKQTASYMVTVTTVIVSMVMVVMVMAAFCRKSWHLGGNTKACLCLSHVSWLGWRQGMKKDPQNLNTLVDKVGNMADISFEGLFRMGNRNKSRLNQKLL